MGFLFTHFHIDCLLKTGFNFFTVCSLYFKLEDTRYDGYILKNDLTQGVFNLLFLKRFKLHQISPAHPFKIVISDTKQLEDFLLCFELVFHSNVRYISFVPKFTKLSKEEILEEFEKVQKCSNISEITPII